MIVFTVPSGILPQAQLAELHQSLLAAPVQIAVLAGEEAKIHCAEAEEKAITTETMHNKYFTAEEAILKFGTVFALLELCRIEFMILKRLKKSFSNSNYGTVFDLFMWSYKKFKI